MPVDAFVQFLAANSRSLENCKPEGTRYVAPSPPAGDLTPQYDTGGSNCETGPPIPT